MNASSTWKLSPSDLTFLWDECPRCFYLKVVHGFKRPSSPFPKIFGRIDNLMKAYFNGKPATEISPQLPHGQVLFGERWVTSTPITFPNRSTSAYLRGKFDSVVAFTDGSFGVVDFKTSEPRPEHVPFYSRQLHAYAYALENPKQGSFALFPITRLGLLCVEPVDMSRGTSGQIAYIGEATWLDCPRDDVWFLSFIENILGVLESPHPPTPSDSCGYCSYREDARTRGL